MGLIWEKVSGHIAARPEDPVEGRGRRQGKPGLPRRRGGSARQRRREENRSFVSEGTGIVAFSCIMYYDERAKSENKKLDENFGKNFSSFISRYR
jgi:hypothetical protein